MSGIDLSQDNDDTFKILIATDNHLGVDEKNSIRGDDSFVTFEEILQKAVVNQVDFILLGGDLFHDANPSTNSLNRCLRLLRKYTLGDKPIMFEFLSDQSVNFGESLSKTVNYEDPNINVGIPVFSIHGNHDDPSGVGRLSALDILSSSGLINYFGKWTDLTKIEISPLLMQKGETKLAIFGLSYIHDNRLTRLFHDSKVVMERPHENEDEGEEWFNLMVLHQNRADRGPKNYLPEEILPEFLDFVLWGHEHDCRIEPEENPQKEFYVCQPGSSVATSLAEGESIPKNCGLMVIHKKQFRVYPLLLETVRPFVFKSVDLTEFTDEFSQAQDDIQTIIQKFATTHVENMIVEAKKQLTGNPSQPVIPLIRLRLIYVEECQMFSTIRFGQQYTGKVANPTDMVIFKKKIKRTKGGEPAYIDKSAMSQAFNNGVKNDETRVEDIVDRYFEEVEGSEKLEVLFSPSLSELCRRLVSYNDEDAAEKIINFHKEKACEFLNEKLPTEDDIDEQLVQFRDKEGDVHKAMLEMLDGRGLKQQTNSGKVEIKSDSDEFDDIVEIKQPTSRSRRVKQDLPSMSSSILPPLPTRGKGSRGGGRGRGRGASKLQELNVSLNITSNITATTRSSTTTQPKISETFKRSQRSNTSKIVYEVSSNSDTE